MYAVYIATQGNRPDLFPQSEYPNAVGREDYLDYDVPVSYTHLDVYKRQQFGILRTPCRFIRVKGIRQTAPANIL